MQVRKRHAAAIIRYSNFVILRINNHLDGGVHAGLGVFEPIGDAICSSQAWRRASWLRPIAGRHRMQRCFAPPLFSWQRLPRNHQLEKNVQLRLVIAQENLDYGWWEAIVLQRSGDMFTLRYRDYPKLPKFVYGIAAPSR